MSTQQHFIPPPAALLQLTWIAPLAAYAISHLARLGIPDLVEVGPKSADEVAREIGADANAVYRLMRATAAAGVLAEGPDGKFSQTPMSGLLRSDAVPSFRALAIMATQEWQLRGCERPEQPRRGREFQRCYVLVVCHREPGGCGGIRL